MLFLSWEMLRRSPFVPRDFTKGPISRARRKNTCRWQFRPPFATLERSQPRSRFMRRACHRVYQCLYVSNRTAFNAPDEPGTSLERLSRTLQLISRIVNSNAQPIRTAKSVLPEDGTVKRTAQVYCRGQRMRPHNIPDCDASDVAKSTQPIGNNAAHANRVRNPVPPTFLQPK